MLKIKTKFRLLIAFYMLIPPAVIIAYTQGSSFFNDPDFQGAMGVSLAVVILVVFCNPLLIGIKWLVLRQLTHISRVCADIKVGNYTFFTLPNEPNDDSDENEMVALMRDMNWMFHHIRYRHTELEDLVSRRTRDLEEANRALVKARDAAEDSARAKSEFLTTMSHEIRTPMNAVINLSGLALKKCTDPSQKEYLEIIHASSTALLGIINDILDFSKVDAGKLVLESIPLNIRNLFEEIMDMFKIQASDLPVEMVLGIDPAVPRSFYGDPLRLRQVLTNLISNAVKFTKQGEILIQVGVQEKTPDRVLLCFSVKDTGVGIEQQALDTLFCPFTQEDGSTTREFGGTGLGLAISQKLVCLMGGSIEVESRKGEGACFSFTLKVKPAPALESRAVLPLGQTRGQTAQILMKNPNAEQILLNYLTDFGLEAKGRNGSEAGCPFAGILRQSNPPPTLVLLDSDMDPALVDNMLTHFRNLSSQIPIIAIGRAPLNQDRSTPEWAAGFVPKPVKQSILFDTIMEVFTSHQAERPVTGNTAGLPAKAEKQLRILVVEDNQINQTVAREVFSAVGINPVIASDARQALEHIKCLKFHAVLMDIQMPGMDGYQATRLIREMGFADLPVIAMTANAMAEDRQKGLDAGMTAYITKPVDPENLFSTLETCLGVEIFKPGQYCPAPEPAQPERFPGFDLADALRRMKGDQTLFEELIAQFYADNQNMTDRLYTLMPAPSDRLAGEVHRLKGTCATLSAQTLARALEKFERRIKEAPDSLSPQDPETAGCMQDIEQEMARIKSTVETLAGALQHGTEQSPGAGFPEDITDKIERLGRLIEQNSLSAKAFSSQLAAELAHTSLSSRAGRLESQIKRFEFSMARQTFELLLSDLGAARGKTA